jgi:ribonuclease III
MEKDFSQFERKIGIVFSDDALLRCAFTHRSYINEHRGEHLEHNERLEFLGDAVLELATTHFLFMKFPDKAEGELTALRSALVNTNTLSETASALGMNEYLLLSKGEERDTGRARLFLLANAFEAVVGAIYLDQGYDAAVRFVSQFLFVKIEEIVEKRLWLDAKSHFQEKAQDEMGVTPVYSTIKESGPDHDKKFIVGVYLKDGLVAQGEGKSKQEAEQDAARNGLVAKAW